VKIEPLGEHGSGETYMIDNVKLTLRLSTLYSICDELPPSLLVTGQLWDMYTEAVAYFKGTSKPVPLPRTSDIICKPNGRGKDYKPDVVKGEEQKDDRLRNLLDDISSSMEGE